MFSRFNRLLVLTIAVVLVACTETNVNSDSRSAQYAAGQTMYGGMFKMNISEHIRSIFPLNLMDASAFNLMNQVYEGLVRFDAKENRIVPALAESYTVGPNGLVYTFHLRKGVYFHDDGVFENGKGREVKADDIAFCLAQLLTPSEYNRMSAFLVDLIRDGRAYYNQGGAKSKIGGLPAGIRVINDYTIEIELMHSTPNFLTILTHSCCWIYPKELMMYEDGINNWCIGTGPFRARLIKMNEVVILERNHNYWMVDSSLRSLPYLDAVRCNFIQSESEQLRYFKAGYIDLIFNAPIKQLAELEAEKEADPKANFEIRTYPGLYIEYYGFQNRGELFSDERIRKAFNYAVNRRFIVDQVLKGNADPAIHGFVPPGMPGYSAEKVHGYTYQPDSARFLLAAAGYPNGEGFPVLSIQVDDGDETVMAVAESVQKMLSRVLNITIELSVLPRNRHYEDVEEGKVDLWRDRWIADYPDAENFLKLFHGKLVPDDSVKSSYLNSVRFKDVMFDHYFEESMSSVDPEERHKLMLQADEVIVEHAAVLPLYYPRWTWLVNTRIQNLTLNGMGHLDLRDVYVGEERTAVSLSN